MTEDRQDHALSFGGVADAYERGRPTYPSEAALWLTDESPLTVLELGAGTGKLTRELVALGHTVHATDPDQAMLDILLREVPDVASATVGTAEQIAAPPRTYDVVLAAQCFHWFDLDRALPEIARVLKPGGRLALVWNERDDRVPWVKRLGALIGSHDQANYPIDALLDSGLFGEADVAEVKFRQHVDRGTIQDLVLSRSNLAVLDDAARATRITDVLALYDEYGRGMDGMQLPYFCRCFSAPVLDLPLPVDTGDDEHDEHGDEGHEGRSSDDTMPRGLRGDGRHRLSPEEQAADDQMILIDFR